MQEINKKGQLGGAFSNTIVVMVIGILMIVTIYVFTQLGSTFTAGTSAANASTSLTTQFSNQIPLVGVLVAIVFIAAIIALIVGSFMGRTRA
jgi:NADH:ubiquinone oxidoreductase subunit 5 (subunit L)/multisubunit Na+/H+ antiporter MnhA subunit